MGWNYLSQLQASITLLEIMKPINNMLILFYCIISRFYSVSSTEGARMDLAQHQDEKGEGDSGKKTLEIKYSRCFHQIIFLDA